jgi:hypothetical protein
MKNLKYIFSLIVFITVHFHTVYAQNNLKFGIKGGVNFANINLSDIENNKVITGVNFGVFAKLPLSNSFVIQPEMYFTTKGSELTYQTVFVDGTAKFELNYIEIPVMVLFNLGQNFNFQIGPYASYLVSSKVKNVTNVNFNFEDTLDSGDFNKFDTGIAVGLGFDTKTIGFGIRYNLGLVTVGEEKTYLGTNYVFPDGKNGVINLFLTYSIL